MKYRNVFLAVTLFSLFVTGCQKEKELLLEEDFFISSDDAERIAERISGSLPDNGSEDGMIIDFRDAGNQGEASKVKTIHAINDKDNKPALYILNYEKGGFIILSADIRMGPILSISEIGSFEVTDNYPEGLNNWMRNIKESIEILRTGNYEADDIQRQAWEALLNVENNHIETRNGSSSPLEYIKVLKIKRVMNSKWNHHGEGYNDSVPLSCPNNPGGKAYAGCVPVTVGQILRYFKHPKSYDWDNMPTSYATPTTAKFLVDIGKDLQVYYTCNSGSGSYMNIAYALRNFYGYSATYDNTYTFDELKGEMDNGRPVVLSGPANLHDGNYIEHAWICEGYMEYLPGIGSRYSMDKESKQNIDTPRKLLYMNWGWNEFNGWYSNEKHINGVGRFYIQNMIKDIYPNE